MTVPFIMALGVGFAAVRSDKHAEDDSFGLVALCSIGPIMAVLLLGFLYRPENTGYTPSELPVIRDSVGLWQCFAHGLPEYMGEIAVSLLPIVLFFAIFQVISLKIRKKPLLKIVIGMVYTYIGLVLFLTGVNVGFMPAGNYLGETIAGLPYRFVLIPIGMVIGYFIVKAEPAVYVPVSYTHLKLWFSAKCAERKDYADSDSKWTGWGSCGRNGTEGGRPGGGWKDREDRA